MTLVPGQKLSQYEVLGTLGAGAMGEVYRARDASLGREVAIKILPAEVADDDQRLARFRREARALASLQHPNVASIYGLDASEGTSFIAMELVRGEDLADRIGRGPLPVAEAIAVCRQIAEGLEAAHDAGVVHRDLKPANVRITPEGVAKVLDFGLSRPLLRGDALLESEGALVATSEGQLIGTPAYMCPEQSRGQAVGRSADLWAFGCLLFECFTGKRPFDGRSGADLLAAIIDCEPDWNALPEVPPRVEELLRRTLSKDPRRRMCDAGEARVQLELALSEPGRRQPKGNLRALLPATGLGLLGILGGFLIRGGEERVSPELRELRLTDTPSTEEMPAVSPDGGKVAFVSRVDGIQQVFVRLVATGSPYQITRGEEDHRFPRWVDEDRLIYLRRAEGDAPGALFETDYLGSSTPTLVYQGATGDADVEEGTKRIATIVPEPDGSASLVVLGGGQQRRESRIPLPVGMYTSPRWSPDGDEIAYEARWSLNNAEIRVMDVESGASRTVVPTAETRGLAWLRDGSGLLYSSSAGSTIAYPPVFSLRRVALDGSREARLPHGGGGYASYVQPDVGPDGRVVASRVALESDVYRFPVSGEPEENVANALRITHQNGLVQVPTVNPEGTEVAFLSDSGGHANVWVATVDGSRPPRRITDERDPDTVIGLPLWSPTDDWIVYWRGTVGQPSEQWLVRPDGSENRSFAKARGGAAWSRDGKWLYSMAHAEDLLSAPTVRFPIDGGEPEPVRQLASGLRVSSDGGTAYFTLADFQMGEVWKASPVGAENPELLVGGLESRIPLWPHQYVLSPDDKWLATMLRDHGTTNLWLISTEDGSLRPVTDFGRREMTIARSVSWTSDSRYLFAAVMETDSDLVMLDGVIP